METPPPFVHRENGGDAAPVADVAQREPEAAQPEAVSASLPAESAPADSDAGDATADAVAALGITGDVAQRIEELLRNAEAEGYLRGRNAKIEATQRFEPDPDPDLDPAPASLPSYHASTLWDIG